jgi:hypothetical protein
VRPAGAPPRQRWRCMMPTLRPRRQLRHRQTLTAGANANAPGLYRYWWWLTHYSIRCLAWLAPEIGPKSTRRRRPGTGFRAAHRAAARLAPAGFNPSRCAALASAVLDTHNPTKYTLATAQHCTIPVYYCNIATFLQKFINMCETSTNYFFNNLFIYLFIYKINYKYIINIK